jgi:hypothetical protein
MTNAEITKAAVTAKNAISGYKANDIIMNFVTSEAREKVAGEIRAEFGGGTTAKAVELLEIRHQNIKSRVQEYINIGLIGCFMASLEVVA